MTSSTKVQPSVRFAFVTSHLDLGGSTTWLCDLTGELHRRQIPVKVFSLLGNHPLEAEFRERGIRVVAQDDRQLIYEERLLATLEGVRDFQPTTVVGWTGEPAYEALRYVPQGILRIAALHSDLLKVYEGAKPYEQYMDWVAVLSSRMVEETIRHFQCPVGKILHLRLGVDAPSTPKQLDYISGRPLRILYLGRVCRDQKRVHLFPEILRALCAADMPFVWTIVGDGPDRLPLERMMVTSNASQVVRVIGSVTYSKIPELLHAHDLFLLTSDYEGLPHTLLEAMGHGLVPVISDLPGMDDVVRNEKNGLLVNMHDVTGYARAILWLHNHRQEMASMAQAAQRLVRENFSIQTMTDQWLTMVPTRSTGVAGWPEKFRIKRPLVHPWPWAFREPFRTARRVVKKLSSLQR